MASSSSRLLLLNCCSGALRSAAATRQHRSAALVTARQFSGSQSLLNKVQRFYTPKHEWIALEESGKVGTVGITDFAQDQLGDVVYVELPEVGKQLSAGETAGAIESVKAASDLYAPVSGQVVECNAEVEEKPHLVNKHCYDKGWLYKLKVADAAELKALMDEGAYAEFKAREQSKEEE